MNEISDQTVSEIKLLSHIAKANRTVLSIADVVALTSTTLTENALIEAWNLNRDLSDAYVLRHDLVVEKWTPLLESSPNNLTHETQKKKRSEEYIRYANQFLNWCQGRHARLLSVSGSTSYNSAMPGDDLDFFVVSPQNHLWIFLVKSLLLARIYRMVHRKCPRICLSYVIDDSFASKAFGAQDPLLARDTLNVVVLYGNAAYASLLRRNNWMANYFPKLYRRRSGEAGPDLSVSQPQGITAFTRCTNLFLYFPIRQYIRIKSRILNHKLRKRGQLSALFVVDCGPDHCIFESARYASLRTAYHNLGKTFASDNQIAKRQ